MVWMDYKKDWEKRVLTENDRLDSEMRTNLPAGTCIELWNSDNHSSLNLDLWLFFKLCSHETLELNYVFYNEKIRNGG